MKYEVDEYGGTLIKQCDYVANSLTQIGLDASLEFTYTVQAGDGYNE